MSKLNVCARTHTARENLSNCRLGLQAPPSLGEVCARARLKYVIVFSLSSHYLIIHSKMLSLVVRLHIQIDALTRTGFDARARDNLLRLSDVL